MTGDDMARAFDKLIAELLEAVAHREALGLPLPKGATRDPQLASLAPWFASKEGRSKVKKTLAALKAERAALKAVAKFCRKAVKEPDVEKAPAESATAVEAAHAPAKASPRSAKAATGAERPARTSSRARRSPPAAAKAAPAKPPASRGKTAKPEKDAVKATRSAGRRTSPRTAPRPGGAGSA